MEKQHKYNVGDEITVKIAKVEEEDSKTYYRIKGVENIKFSEGGMNAMEIQKAKPGDIIFGIYVDEEGHRVCIEKFKIVDIGHYEVKIFDDWMPLDESMVFDEAEVERKAQELSKLHGYVIVRKNWLGEDENDRV